MIVVMGREPSVLVGVTDRLRSRGLPARALADAEDLFDVVWQEGGHTLVVVDSLPRVAGPEPPATPLPWDEVLRVARGPKRPRVVWCTPRPESDPGVRLRRSGIAYTTVRAGALVSSHDLGLGDVQGRTVHLAKDLPVPDAGLTALGTLIETLVEASTTPRLGHAFDVRLAGAGAWPKLVEALGGRPKPTTRTMARVMSWVGARALVALPSDGAPMTSSGGVHGVTPPLRKETDDERASAA